MQNTSSNHFLRIYVPTYPCLIPDLSDVAYKKTYGNQSWTVLSFLILCVVGNPPLPS
uniref:Uncharacterized protein n=1 Tax=Rhizophora mucronata TaxID=61149 RepID=A0A2P2QWS3_RHIMU